MRLPPRRALRILLIAATVTLPAAPARAQTWHEMKSPHFTVTSSASQGATRTLVWQLEQVRSGIGALFAWARTDLDRPIAVYAVGDERGMRALVPHYWEQKGGVRPGTVWVTGRDQHYLAIRTDLRADDGENVNLNPHISAYFSYASLVLQQSVPADMPLWFTRGFAGVLSNTIVRDTQILFGPTIPWHLRRLREGSRLSVPALVRITRESPEFNRDSGIERFDAQSWALVHFLMFADEGVRRPKLDRFTRLVASGTGPDAAMREAFGDLEQLDTDYVRYVNRNIFMYYRFALDASVEREKFPARILTPAESSAALALLHVAMRRPVEARAAIAAARTASPAPAASFLAEAFLIDGDGRPDESRPAYERAVELGSTNAYAYYRLATLRWGPQAEPETLRGIEKLLLKAVSLNNRHAASYAMLGEVRSLLGSVESIGLVRRAIQLDPGDAYHWMTAARILMRQRKYDEAMKDAQAALSLSEQTVERQRVQTFIDTITAAKSAEARRAATAPSVETSEPVAVRGGPEPLLPGPGVAMPRLRDQPPAAYSMEAMRMAIEGLIVLDAVVLPDGTVGPTTVKRCDLKSRLQENPATGSPAARDALAKSAFKPGSCAETFGLSSAAVKSVEQWRFEPGTKQGTAVPIRVEVQVSFTLK